VTVPRSSDGDENVDIDPLDRWLSWGEADSAKQSSPTHEDPESADLTAPEHREAEAAASGDIGASRTAPMNEGPGTGEGSTAAGFANRGATAAGEDEPGAAGQAGYGESGYDESGYGPPWADWSGYPQPPYPLQGEGPTPYEQPSWPSQYDAQQQWPTQWSYGPPPPSKIPKRPPRSTPDWFGVALVAALVGALAGGGTVAVFTSHAPQTIVREYFPTKGDKVQVGDVQSILASVLPAVVSIDTSSFRGVGAIGSYVQGAGTGMIIEPSGVILTNDHVIAGAQTITVTLYGQVKQFAARIIGADAQKDIALVQVEGAGSSLPTVRFGNSNAAQQGDGVLAIGNALALAGGPTVTEGIVSALDRSLSATTDNGTTENLTGLIQTDAPINPGNSGGPLVNSSGQVVAMNTAVATSSQGNAPAQNVGFAIAVDEIRAMVSQILHQAGLKAP
jgi:putative serine protease PepD